MVALIGPCQTTPARQIVPGNSANHFDLESPRSLARLEQPLTALEGLRGTVAIEENPAPSRPFPILRVLC